MNEIDKLKRARLYMEKLASGIDPNSGNRVHVDDIVRDPRVIACFEYISRVLGWEIEAFENKVDYQDKPRRRRVYINADQLTQLKVYNMECKVSDITNEVNRVIADNGTRKMQAAWITDWLEKIGMLCRDDNGNRLATPSGSDIGISSILKTSPNGQNYYLNLYSSEAQKFILDNLTAIIEYHYTK